MRRLGGDVTATKGLLVSGLLAVAAARAAGPRRRSLAMSFRSSRRPASPRRGDGADAAHQLSRGAAVGGGHPRGGPAAQDAALVRRRAARLLRQRLSTIG